MVIGVSRLADPWNEIQVIAEDLVSLEPCFCKLVHLFREINNGDHSKQDQHTKKKVLKKRLRIYLSKSFKPLLIYSVIDMTKAVFGPFVPSYLSRK